MLQWENDALFRSRPFGFPVEHGTAFHLFYKELSGKELMAVLLLLVCGHGNESGPILPQCGKDAFASFSSLIFLDLFLAEQGQWASPNFPQGFDNCFLPPSNQASLSEIWCKFSARSSISFHLVPKATQEFADHTSDQHHLFPTPSTVSQPSESECQAHKEMGAPGYIAHTFHGAIAPKLVPGGRRGRIVDVTTARWGLSKLSHPWRKS